MLSVIILMLLIVCSFITSVYYARKSGASGERLRLIRWALRQDDPTASVVVRYLNSVEKKAKS